MARQYVATFCTADALPAFNAYLVGLFGDDPGSEEISLNAYVDGANPGVATHSFSNMNTSAADAASIAAYAAVESPDVASRNRPVASGSYGWADALTFWGLKPVVPGV